MSVYSQVKSGVALQYVELVHFFVLS